jgi:putative peptidoglycan lipid II flippase
MSLKLIKSISVVGSMTLLSRISGLARDMVFANLLGDKAAADIFFVAFRIPNFFRRIFGEGAFSIAFVPVFTDYRLNRTEAETNSFLQLLIGRFGLILLLVSVLGVVFAPALVTMLASGFISQPEKFNLAVDATRITFPYLFFISFVAMSGGMLNTCGRFAAPAATPILLNICLICAALFLVPLVSSSPIALAIGVLAAGGAQLLFQIPFLRKEKLSIKPRVVKQIGDDAGIEGAVKVFHLTLPAILGVSVAQINMIVNTMLASFLVTGSISWLYYSDRLMEFPVGVFGIALSTAILPDLSRKHSQRSPGDFSRTLDWAMRWVFLICVPATVGLIVLAPAIVTTIYYHGDFSINGVNMTVSSLIAFSFGLIAIAMVKVLAPGFYARQNTKTPVRIAMIAMGLNIVVSLALVWPLKHVGLALGTSISAIANAAMLFVMLRREGVYFAEAGWLVFLVRVVLAGGAMGVALWWFMGSGELWFDLSVWNRIVKLGVLIGLGGIVYFSVLFLVGVKAKSLWPAKESNQ